eukprot:7386948-Prymnesium_polylepis.2
MLRPFPVVAVRRLAAYHAGCCVNTKLPTRFTECTSVPPTRKVTLTLAVKFPEANQLSAAAKDESEQYATPDAGLHGPARLEPSGPVIVNSTLADEVSTVGLPFASFS